MKSFIVVLVMTCLIYSCSHHTTPTTPSQPAAAVEVVKPPADVPKAIAKKMETPEVVAGKELYTTKCARCHGPKPVENWTVAEWVPIMDRMAPKARLDATEKTNVTAYVNFYAKSGS